MKKFVLVSLLGLLLTACGTAVTGSTASTVVRQKAVAAVPVRSSAPVQVAPKVASTLAPLVAPTVAPRVAAPGPRPVSPSPIPMRLTFGLFPVGSMVSGSVVVVRTNTGLLATVFANGLVPASVHTVHIHRGNCADPYGGMHITVLGLMAGGPADNGVLTAPIAPVYLSPGHYVIVYATASAQRIIACANL